MTRSLGRTQLAAAALAGAALVSTIVGRLMACPGCDYAILGAPLSTVGAIYYLVLVVLALCGVSPRAIGWISLPAVAVQAGLVRFLLSLGSPCATCMISAACLLALALVCLWHDPRWRATAFACAVTGFVSLPLWSMGLVEVERLEGLPSFARASDFRSAPAGATLLVAYVREGCPYCRAFERDYEPRLVAEFGASLAIRKIDVKDRGKIGRLPTLLIRDPKGSYVLVRGLPRYPDLQDALKPR